MRIIQVVHSFYPNIGGIEQHVYHLSREFAKGGQEVVVYTTGKGSENFDGILVKRFWSLRMPLFSSVNFSPGLLLALMLEHGDIFASHGYGSLMPYFTSLIAWIKRKPFIFTLHGYPKMGGIDGIFHKIYKIFFAFWFLKIANRIIVVSKTTEEDAGNEIDRKKIVLIPNGVAKEFFSVKKSESSKIAYIGRLDRYKRVDILIDAFAKLKEMDPELRLVLIGDDDGVKNKLEQQVKDLGLDVEFTSAKPSEMPGIYSKLKAVVLPSGYEGFSLVWLEAMASKTAMFSTPVGEAPVLFPLAYGDGAGKFLFSSKDELVEKLRAFLKNEKDYNKLLISAQTIVKNNYGWQIIAERTLKIYNEVSK